MGLQQGDVDRLAEHVLALGGDPGVLAAARLKEKGVTDLRIIEAGGDFGGTWYWNRYPGVQCDNDAYCYLPLLEEKAKSTLTPVVISNMDEIKELIKLSGSVTVGETPIIRIKK